MLSSTILLFTDSTFRNAQVPTPANVTPEKKIYESLAVHFLLSKLIMI